jgi:anti-anti-sigma factor
MKITERRTADIVTLSLSGKLDGTTAKTFEEKILTRIDSGARRFIIDVAELNYVSSAGLRVFVLAAKRLGSTNGKLVLCGFKKTIPYHTLNRILDPVRETFDTTLGRHGNAHLLRCGFSDPNHADQEESIKN